jgi:uncharacterized small protein (DUF1192 family)
MARNNTALAECQERIEALASENARLKGMAQELADQRDIALVRAARLAAELAAKHNFLSDVPGIEEASE